MIDKKRKKTGAGDDFIFRHVYSVLVWFVHEITCCAKPHGGAELYEQ